MCALLGYYVALCGNCLPTFRDILVPIFKGQESKPERNPTCNIDINWEDLHGVGIMLADPHPARTFPVNIYITGWISFWLGLLTPEDGTDNVLPKCR
jgi:hypothetical protein